MNVREIVKKYLEQNGFDGLVCQDGECGCILSDVSPCGDMLDSCEPGYVVPCPGPDGCPNGGGCEWHVATTKREVT